MQKKPSLAKRTSRRYHQGQFYPLNPNKYIGNVKEIIYRSKWELLFLKWADSTPQVIRYNSEECVIPYISPIDGKQHRYFMDFFIEVQAQDNTIQKYLIEIKPYAQTQIPKRPKDGNILSESYMDAVKTYVVNQAKWKAANEVCKSHGWIFKVITEKELFKHNKRYHHGKK